MEGRVWEHKGGEWLRFGQQLPCDNHYVVALRVTQYLNVTKRQPQHTDNRLSIWRCRMKGIHSHLQALEGKVL